MKYTKEEDKKVIYGFKTGKVFDISRLEAQNDAVVILEIDLGIKTTTSTKIGLKSILGGINKFIKQHCEIEEYEAELCTLIFGSYFNFNIDGNIEYKGLEAILQEGK